MLEGGVNSLERSMDSPLLKAAKIDVEAMKQLRPHHPTSLQAASMMKQYQWRAAEPQMFEGFRACLHLYLEPATAMQHILQCMYIELTVRQYTSSLLCSR